MEIKHLDLSNDRFEANGTTYYIRNTLTIGRFPVFEKLQNHYAWGLEFEQLYNKVNQIKELFDKGKSVDAFYLLENTRLGIKDRVENRQHPALLICSLFMVTENEDITKWDEAIAKKKIEDWKIEGYAINDFFQFASNFVKGFIRIYNEISQDILKEEEKGKSNSIDKKSSK